MMKTTITTAAQDNNVKWQQIKQTQQQFCNLKDIIDKECEMYEKEDEDRDKTFDVWSAKQPRFYIGVEKDATRYQRQSQYAVVVVSHASGVALRMADQHFGPD